MKRSRVIGTTSKAVKKEESLLGRRLPPSFQDWLLNNNGLGINGIHIYPVKDERDIRKTWESLSHNYNNGWASWLDNFNGKEIDTSYLLPFADFGSGDYYCFDYSKLKKNGECSVVRWSHETCEAEFRAKDFAEFKVNAEAGKFDND